ncbi:MAG TPA: TIGR04255 family protein [Verrucomicrobiae bacterium]|nr:TIGR04255 family protein [Verrucomicrobiae bacterium]
MAGQLPLNIDLNEAFPHLAHAPIVEAVIEIRARAGGQWEEAAVTQHFKHRLPEYPLALSQNELQHEVTFSPEQPKPVTRQLGWHGLQFRSADEKYIARFTRDGFLLARLQPYENWERLFGEAMRLWQMHIHVAQPLEIQRVGLRFINRLEMQPGEARCEDYIKMNPDPTGGLDLPVMGFFHQDTLVVPGDPLAVNVIRTLQPPAPPSGVPALIFDIDAFTTAALELNHEELVKRLRQMRWLKNKVFFCNIAHKALSRFK